MMRASTYAMADTNHTPPEILAPVLGAVATAVGAALIWLAQRLLGKAAVQQAVNAGFMALMEQTREELKASREQRDEYAQDLAHERAQRVAAEQSLRGEIDNLRAVIRGLERLLREHGIPLPPRPQATQVSFQQSPLDDEE